MEVKTMFSPEAINQQTKRILSFPLFRNSPVLSRFLEFIISETIHQKEVQIKEYSIAINVLHRTHAFNPNGDSIVRIHAGRLRRALNDFFETRDDMVRNFMGFAADCYGLIFKEWHKHVL